MVKYIKIAAFIALFLSSSASYGQVLVSQVPINPVQFHSEDIWEVNLINNGEPVTAYLKGILNDENGKRIFEAFSGEFSLQVGLRTLRKNDITTLSLNFNSSHPNSELIRQYKNLPYGEYTLCIYLYNKETDEQLGESCIEHVSEPVSPPILITPDYCEEVHTKFPFFSWLAPSPEIKGQEVYYSFKLTEVFTGQSNEDAVQRNLAIVFIDNLTQTSLLYPSTAPPLDSNKTYAWQVQAKIKKYNGNENPSNLNTFRNIGVSEAWCLNYKIPELPEIITEKKNITYAIPKLYEDAEIQVTNILYLSFVENYVSGLLNYTIYDNKGEVVDLMMPLTANKGDNRYDINLKQTTLFRHNTLYKLVIKGNDKETYYLNFRYIEK